MTFDWGSLIHAVIFDLDGVIVSTDRYHYKAWKNIADEESVYFDSTINERLKGVSRMESLEILLENCSKKYTAEEKLHLAERKNEFYVKLIDDLKPNDIITGTKLFMEKLKSIGIKIALASSSRNAYLIIERIGLKEYFNAVVDGNDITRSKPNPEVFIIASNRLSVNPSYCIVVEDSIAGIDAAIAAGMLTIGVGNAANYKKVDLKTDYSFNIDLKDLSRYIESKNTPKFLE